MDRQERTETLLNLLEALYGKAGVLGALAFLTAIVVGEYSYDKTIAMLKALIKKREKEARDALHA